MRELDPDFVVASVRETRRAARFDTDDPAAADMPAIVRETGVRSAVASPIVVEGELWGAIMVGSLSRSLPHGTERRLADFTELVATAVANAQARQEVTSARRGAGGAAPSGGARRAAACPARSSRPSPRRSGLLFAADLAVLTSSTRDGTAIDDRRLERRHRRVPPVGTTGSSTDGDNLAARIFESGAPARIDSYAEVAGR